MKKLPYISIILLPTLLAGCLSDRESCPDPGTGPTKESRLNLTLTVGYPSTRAGNSNPENGTREENYIDIEKDLKTYILVKADGTEDWKIFQEFEPDMIVPGNGTYLLSGKLPDELRSRDIRLLALANWGSMNDEAPYPVITDGKDILLSTLYFDGSNYNFDYLPASNATWTPSAEGKGIPMAGITESKRIPAPDNLFVLEMDMGQLPMLRSLAKIEIVDMTQPENHVSIKGVTLTPTGGTSYNTTGRLIPDGTNNPDWYKEDKQVIDPSLPKDVTASSSALTFKSFTDSEDHQVFRAYVPEMDLTGDNPPVMNVNLDVNGDSKSYRVQFAKYEGKTIGEPYKHLLRNHIYRFNITKVETGIDMDLTLEIETPNWDVDDDQNWDYEDAMPKFDEPFIWKDYEGKSWGTDESFLGKFDNTDVYDMYRILLIGNSEESAAYGYFNMSTPADNNPGTWTIALVSDDDTKNDHFKIEVKTSEDEWEIQGQGDSFTAEIGDDPVEFRIMATGTNGSSTDYTARVVMVVKTFDGRLINIPLRSQYGNETIKNETITSPTDSRFYFMVKQLTTGGDNI